MRCCLNIWMEKAYDEEKLLSYFQNEPFIRNFSVAKAYLYDAILKCMQAYTSGKSTERQIVDLLHATEFLYIKNLES